MLFLVDKENKMDLGTFLSRMRIPSFYGDFKWGVYNSNAEGFVTLKHPHREIPFDGTRTLTESCYHTEYIAFLGIIRDNPNLKFEVLYAKAVEQCGFPDCDSRANLHLRMLLSFNRIGAVSIGGKTKREDYNEDNIQKDVQFSVDNQGLKQIEVLSAQPKDPSRKRKFRKYFPSP